MASMERWFPPRFDASGFHWKARLMLVVVAVVATGSATSLDCAETLKKMGELSSDMSAKGIEETAAIGKALGKMDNLIAEIETRIKTIWAEAEKVLDRADATDDPHHRQRLEELYGKIVMLAEGIEDQHAQLLSSRDALVETCERMRQ